MSPRNANNPARTRFITVALLLHIPLFVYPVLRLGQWLEAPWLWTLIALVPIFFSQIFARVVLRDKEGKRVFVLRTIADFVLGIAPIAVMLLAVAEVLILLFPVSSYMAALGVVCLTTIISIIGTYHAFNPNTVKVTLNSSKITTPQTFVQLTDVHIGSRSTRFLRKVMEKVQQLNPDYLCITGDFIDQPGITAQQLSALKLYKGPIYFSIGNHEKYEDLNDIVARLRSLGVHVLRDQTMTVGDTQFIGIDDKEDHNQVEKQLQHITVNPDKYSVLLYHRPRGLEACHEHGIDLMISGHTHAGQIVPFNLAVNKVFERTKGLYTHGQSSLYVSEGTGTWGPVLRLGTRSEITLFTIKPA